MTHAGDPKLSVRTWPALGLCALTLAVVGYGMLAMFMTEYVPTARPWSLKFQRQMIDVALGVVMLSSVVGIVAIFSTTKWNRVIGWNLNYFNLLMFAALFYMLCL